MEIPHTELTASDIPSDIGPLPAQGQTSLTRVESQPFQVDLYTESTATPEFSRLVVLVPDRDVDETAFARKIWALVGRRRTSILFVSLVTNSKYGPRAQRRLITLAAVTQDRFYDIRTRIFFGRSWIKGLEEIVRPGDLIVCHSSQRSRSYFGEDTALADLVISRIKVPVCILTGLYQDVASPRSSQFVRQVIFWGVLIGIMAVFFVFEADIDHLTSGWMNKVLFLLVFGVEISLIWMWNFIKI